MSGKSPLKGVFVASKLWEKLVIAYCWVRRQDQSRPVSAPPEKWVRARAAAEGRALQ